MNGIDIPPIMMKSIGDFLAFGVGEEGAHHPAEDLINHQMRVDSQ